MAEADWTQIPSPGLDTSDVPRGVSSAFTPPDGGGSFVMGFRSVVTTTGFAGYTCAVSGYAPGSANKGGSIRCAMKRYSSGAQFAPMMGLITSTDPATGSAYILGLSEADGYQIALKKGYPAAGLDPSGSDILRLSTSSWTDVGDDSDAWKHLRLDVLVNPHDEVVIDVYENDLDTNAVTAPSWAAVTGMSQYVDDSVGILTGSTPYLGPFYFFFGQYSEVAGAESLFDHVQVYKQTSP